MWTKKQQKEYHKNYYAKNKKHYFELNKKWSAENKEKLRAYYRKKAKNPVRIAYMKNYLKLYKERRTKELKDKIFNHYGNKCACCGENNKKFLSIDHINNDGNKNNGGMAFYASIVRNNYPKDLQILCFNCNWGKYINKGICPHKEI